MCSTFTPNGVLGLTRGSDPPSLITAALWGSCVKVRATASNFPASAPLTAWTLIPGRGCVGSTTSLLPGSSSCWMSWPLLPIARRGRVAQASHPEQGVVDAVASEAAIPQDLPALHAGEGVLHAGPDPRVGLFVRLSPGGSSSPSRRWGGIARHVPGQPPSAIVVAVPTASLVPDSAHALQSFRMPASGRPTRTTSRVPSTMRTVSLRNRFQGRRASIGPSRRIVRFVRQWVTISST